MRIHQSFGKKMSWVEDMVQRRESVFTNVNESVEGRVV